MPSRCARTASVPDGTCRYSTAVSMSLIVRTSGGSVDGATCADRTTDRQAHTRAPAVARHGTDWATIAGTAGAPATEQTLGTIHGAQNPSLGASVGQTLVRHVNPELRSRARASRSRAVSFFTRRRSSRTSWWSSDALRSVNVQAHHDLRDPGEPPTGCRARDSEIRGDGHVLGALDEIPKPVVVPLLRGGL